MTSLTTSSSTQVQGTNDSSIVSKLSMLNLGYGDDKYLKNFVRKPQRRTPLINRGYYARYKAVRHVVNKFLEDISGPVQIVSLGAGFDTTYFVTNEKYKNEDKKILFIEIDYSDVMKTKISLGKSCALFLDHPSTLTASHLPYTNGNYMAIGYDLREIGSGLVEVLQQSGIDFTFPTLFISEVVLTYLTSSQSSRVLRWINHYFPNAMTAIFEQMLPFDGFGIVMCRHFENIGSPLLSISSYPTLMNQEKRHRELGFQKCFYSDLHSFYLNLPSTERRRIEGLEMFDEFEGWHQMCQHYFVLCSTNSQLEALKKSCQEMFKTSGESIQLMEPQQEHAFVVRNSAASHLELFGHSMVTLPDSKQAIVVGGFGVPFSSNTCNNTSHQRLRSFYSIDLESLRVEECRCDSNGVTHAMFTSAVLHRTKEGRRLLVLFGGRESPSNASNLVRVFEIKFITDTNKLELKDAFVLDKLAATPPGRWRHSCTLAYKSDVNDLPRIFIIGGRNESCTFSDCWCLDLDSWTMDVVNLKDGTGCSDTFTARHSHSSVFWKCAQVLVISAGLDDDMKPLNDVILLKTSGEFRRLSITPSLSPRYSHTSHIVGEDILLLVGGVCIPPTSSLWTSTASMQDDIAVIDLKNCVWTRSVKFPVSHLDRPLRVHGHTSLVTDAKGKNCTLAIVGGGSNCFSFGTAFNETPLQFSFNLQ